MNTPHTPEPWHIGMKPGPIIYGPNGEQIADMRSTLLGREEHLANIRLMTAAPLLLAALKDTLNTIKALDEDFDLRASYIAARAAIAKVGGAS